MSVQPFTTPTAPNSPDFYECDGDTYGKRLNRRSCLQVANLLPQGEASITWPIGGSSPFDLPWQLQRGNCRITVDLAGPGVSVTHFMTAPPDHFRGAAFWLIQQCVKNGGGVGGFSTLGFHYMTDFLIMPNINYFDVSTWSSHTSFFTVTVDGGGEDKNPGDNSPKIPDAIARLMADKSAEDGPDQGHYGAGADWFLNKAEEVNNGHTPWFCGNCGFGGGHSSGTQGHQTYECDAGLGAPTPVDCSQLDYSQLGAPSDTLTIGPAAPKLLTSNTCDIAISSDQTVTLQWSDVRSALDTLVGLCVSNPLGSSIGGRTYYESTPLAGRGLVSHDDYTLDFLAPGVNLTLYQAGHYVP